MTREEYNKKRLELVSEAQNNIDSGEHEKSIEVQNKIKELDEEMKNISEAQANLNALNTGVTGANIIDASKAQNIVPIGGGIEPINFVQTDLQTTVDDDALNKSKDLEYVNAWAKDMMKKPLNQSEQAIFDAKNQFVHDTGNSGILIPETVVSGIWKEVGEQYPLWEDVFKTSVKGSISLLKSESTPDAEWYDEDTETGAGELTFSKDTLNGCELSRSIKVSWKLREMAIEDFIPFIQSTLAEKIGKALGYAVALGKGKPKEGDTFKEEPRGIITALKGGVEGKKRILTYGASDKLSYDKCTKLMGLLKTAYKKGAFIYANNDTIWNELANILDATGRPYFVPDVISGGVGRILGMIVKEDDSIPKGYILAANANKGYHANINKQVVLDSEENKKKRQTEYFAYGIVDGDIRTYEAFAMIAPEGYDATEEVSKSKGKAKNEDKE